MTMREKLVRGLVAGGLAVVLTAGTAFASIGTGTVTAGSSLRLRAEPNTSSATLAVAPKNAQVDVLEDAGSGWYKVSYKGVEGYMSGQWLSVVPNGDAADAADPADDAADAGTNETDEAPAPAETSEAAYVNAGPLNVRSGPGTGYSRVGSLSTGSSVTVVETLDGWYKVTSGNVTGYVSARYITLGTAPQPAAEVRGSTAPDPQKGYVSTSALNVRSGPGTDHDKIGSLGYGDTVTIVGEEDGWYQITSGSLAGYVSKEYISSSPVSVADASSLGAKAAALAKKQVGKRYVYGATGPNSFDCSGLVYYVYRSLGVNMSRGASGQYYNNGRFISKSQSAMQPGDLVFFFNRKNDSSGGRLPVTHVGIYVGDNKFVHASSPSTGVEIETLFGGYHSQYLVAVKRIG